MDKQAAAPSDIPIEDLREIERLAADLVRLAGTEMVSALGKVLAVRYKGEPDRHGVWHDPVSDVDQRVEELIRTRVAERFPDHDVIGEESAERPRPDSEFVWAVDPIDGTTNFINGFPLFAASIGLLHRGRPVAGAVWCASSHALRAGVYHAHLGGRFHFDDEALDRRSNPEVRRRLAGVPGSFDEVIPWDGRKSGSAAIECAFVAAGLLEVALFERPNVWDVAGGVALVLAAGGAVRSLGPDGWEPLEAFIGPEVKGGGRDLRGWHRPLVLGRTEAVEAWSSLRAAAA